MNNSIRLAVIGLALSSAASFAEDCTAPAFPALPDGATSNMEQMLAGQKAVKAFQASNTEYRACLEPKITAAEIAAAGDSPGPELVEARNALNEQYNDSVSKEEELAAQFNTALREFKEANPN